MNMKFTVTLTNEEKKAIYSRAVLDCERHLITALIAEGHDPDTFDEATFVPAETLGDEFIARNLTQLARLKANVADLG
jgi:hypothetical protein